jgi:hypothetical protein
MEGRSCLCVKGVGIHMASLKLTATMWSYLGSGRWSRPTIVSWFSWRGLSERQLLESSKASYLWAKRSPHSFQSLSPSFAPILLCRYCLLHPDWSLAVFSPYTPIIPLSHGTYFYNSFTFFYDSRLLFLHRINGHRLTGDSQDSSEEDKWYASGHSGYIYLVFDTFQSSISRLYPRSQLRFTHNIATTISNKFSQYLDRIFGHFFLWFFNRIKSYLLLITQIPSSVFVLCR